MKATTLLKKNMGLALAVLICFSSCVSTKKMVYLQTPENISSNISIPPSQKYELTIQPDDQLAISISSQFEELVLPFNSKSVLGQKTSTSTNQELSNFLVDANGYIDFPVLGRICVKNMTCEELRQSLEKEIKEGNHIKDAQVEVKLMSFRVGVFGEVKTPGIQQIQGQRYTILEALIAAGDLLPSGKRKNIKVIREENGARNTYYVDLTNNADVMNSPVYYLKQNDVIYVEPNKSIGIKGSSTLQTVTAFSGIASLLLSITSIIISVSK